MGPDLAPPKARYTCLGCGGDYETVEKAEECARRRVGHYPFYKPFLSAQQIKDFLWASQNSDAHFDLDNRSALKNWWERNQASVPEEYRADLRNIIRAGKQAGNKMELFLMKTGIDPYGGHGARCTCERCWDKTPEVQMEILEAGGRMAWNRQHQPAVKVKESPPEIKPKPRVTPRRTPATHPWWNFWS